MTSQIQLVQGFQGTIPYILEGIDTSKSVIHFNFTDRLKQKRHEILCKQGSSLNEILILFKKQDTSDYGEFYGEFRIVHTNGDVDKYPLDGWIIVRIREGI